MIQSVAWNLGKATISTASDIYLKEITNTWNGAVGLMAPSDYGYAVNSSNCSRSTTLNSYSSTSSCYNNNWLFNNIDQWTIIEDSSTSGAYFYASIYGSIESFMRIGYGNYGSEYGVRPSVYLKSKVKILDNGKDGSQSLPYDLVLN